MSSHNYAGDNSLADPGSFQRTKPIAERAYARFVARGRQEGHALDDWLASEKEVEAEQRERDSTRRG